MDDGDDASHVRTENVGAAGNDDVASDVRPVGGDDASNDGNVAGDVRTDGGAVEDVTTVGDDADATLDRVRKRLNERYGGDFVGSLPFWLPTFLLVGLFVYGAILWNFVISLTDYEGFVGPDYSDLDFGMYARAVRDTAVIDATVNTFLLLVVFTVVALVVGLGLAILVDRNIRFENTFRTIYLLPMSLSFVVTAQFWLWMYNFNNGVVNITLGAFGIGPISWIGNPDVVLWAVVVALVWQFSGYTMVVYLAGLRAIPTDHYEAAKVDGASTLRMYWRVIIPQLKGSTISAAIVLMVFALKAFDFLYSLVGGYRPPNGADILATKMVREAYSTNNWAYASAIAIMLFLMALSVIGPYLYYQYDRGNL